MTEQPAPDPAAVLRDDAALDTSLRIAIAETVRRHRLHGVPLAVWRDGRVQDITAETLGSETPASDDT